MTRIAYLPEKDRRRVRRQNHIARDLRSNKDNQRIVERRKKDYYELEEED